MSPRPNGIHNPPNIISGASLLSRTSSDARKEEWPYAWEHCPPDGEQVYRESVAAFPANASLTQLISYPVPDGLKFRLSHIMLFYTGGLLDGQNIVTWSLATQTPASVVGLTTPVMPSGYPVDGWNAIVISKGSPGNGPWWIPGKLVFKPRDVVNVNVITTNPFPTAGGQFLTSIMGWTWPMEPAS